MVTDSRGINITSDILCIQNPEGAWLHASHFYLKLLGIEKIDYHGKSSKEIQPLISDNENALNLTHSVTCNKQTWKKGIPLSKSETYKNSDQTVQSIEVTRTPVFDQNGKPYLLIISGTAALPDINRLRELKFISTVFSHNITSMLIIDLNFNILRINRAFTNLTGFLQNDLSGRHLSIINGQQNHKVIFKTIQSCIQNNRYWTGEIICRRNDRSTFPAQLNLTPVINRSQNKIQHYIGTLKNLGSSNNNERSNLRLSQHDSVTKLPNRFMFIDRLNQEISRSRRHQHHTVLLLVNLEPLSSIDPADQTTHHHLLKMSSKRLTDTLRCEDNTAYLDNTDFAILLDSHQSSKEAKTASTIVAEKIISRLGKPFEIHEKNHAVRIFIGISIYPVDARTTQDLMKQAEIALYQAKKIRQNNYQFFQQNGDIPSVDNSHLSKEIRQGLTNNEFRLFYQPQYDVKSRKLIGAEVLTRWFKQDNRIVPPFYFIPAAEESGLILPLGRWILEHACKKQKAWLDSGNPLDVVSVNISSRQFNDPGFLNLVESTLSKTSLPPRYLQLEFNESMLHEDPKGVILKLLNLRNVGIKLAVDNFAANASELIYLNDFPIDILKIDQSLIREIPENKEDIARVSTIIGTAHAQDLKIVAEGVETEEQLKFLSNYKCDILQGYLFNPPLPEHEIDELIGNKKSSH